MEALIVLGTWVVLKFTNFQGEESFFLGVAVCACVRVIFDFLAWLFRRH